MSMSLALQRRLFLKVFSHFGVVTSLTERNLAVVMAIALSSQQQTNWPSGIPKEPRALGFCCRVTNVLKAVAILEIINLLVSFVDSVLHVVNGQYVAIAIIVFILIGGWALFQVFNAVDDTKPQGLIPYLVWKYVHVVWMICALGWLIYMAVTAGEYGYYAGLAGVVAVYLVSGVLFLIITHQSRTYLMRKMSFLVGEKFVPNNVEGNSVKDSCVLTSDAAPPPINVDVV